MKVKSQRTAFKRLLAILFLVPVSVGLCCWVTGAVLSCPAELPRRADLVVVLGGDDATRYVRGRQLVVSGYSQHLLLSNPSDAARQDVLKSLQDVDVQFDSWPQSTWQEAQCVHAWMQANGWKSVLVVSDPPHLLRVGYAFASNLRGTGLSYALVATNPSWWSAWRWWQNPVSKNFVISEVVKLIYYVGRYRFGF